MPRSILLCHLVLLACLSVLAGSGVTVLFFDAQRFGLSVDQAQCVTWWAVGFAAVLFITEVFSGVRWPPAITLGASIFGLVALHGQQDVPRSSIWAWMVAWAAVAFWFAYLVDVARRDR